jgi:hypothetical protein
MSSIWVLVYTALAAICLFQAGRFGFIIDIDRQEGRKTELTFHVLYWLDIFFGLYFIICVYGQGIERGGM